MRNFCNSLIVGLKPSGIRKFFDLANAVKGVVSLGVGEPDFDTPLPIREEAIRSIKAGKTFYTSNSGLLELRQAVSDSAFKRLGVRYDPQTEILITIGCSEAIDLALRAVIEPGDEVIVPDPCYVSYKPCALMAGAKVISMPLTSKDDFMITAEGLGKVITPKTKVVVLNYPNNPTGAVMDFFHLKKIAEVIKKNDLLVITDEVYSDLIFDVKHFSIVSLDGMRNRTIYINGFSKSFSMTGWRIGYACGPKSILEQMTKIHQFSIMCVPTSSQFAALEALKNGQQYVVEMVKEYSLRRQFVMAALDELHLDYIIPHGAFYFFVNIAKFGMTSEDFSLSLLKEEKVVVVPGTAFGEAGEGYVRISYAYSIKDLGLAFKRIKRWIKKRIPISPASDHLNEIV